ncbi:MAG: SDR family oxidoreductase [Candidatus Diapherotrites archaeon]|jgi:3-oxoacyl-[acyl-carrier protein] reductase|nr:SDR family oxidoreductase [Candidatus Diapherotrites archaeon]
MDNILQLNPILENLLKDKVIMVTGAGSGLGKALSIGLAFAGAKIGLVDINEEAINTLASELNKENEIALPLKASVTNAIELEKAYSELVNKFTKIDGLINCAGIARLGTIDSLSEKDIKLANDVNMNGYFLNANIASKKMQEGGNIINISSAAARGASKGSSLYGVAKEAQCMMTRSWACDLGEKGIRVNAILCGDLYGDEEKGILSAIWSQTYFEKKAVDKKLVDASDSRLGGETLNPEIRALVVKHYLERTALAKEVTYNDIATMVILLSSELTSKITGESIAVTSGQPTAFAR